MRLFAMRGWYSGLDVVSDRFVVEFFCGGFASFDAKEPQITVRVVRCIQQNTSAGITAPNCFDVPIGGLVREKHFFVSKAVKRDPARVRLPCAFAIARHEPPAVWRPPRAMSWRISPARDRGCEHERDKQRAQHET